MSSKARRAEMAKEWEEEQRRREEERFRVQNLTIELRIDECKADESVKEILRILAERAGILSDVP